MTRSALHVPGGTLRSLRLYADTTTSAITKEAPSRSHQARPTRYCKLDHHIGKTGIMANMRTRSPALSPPSAERYASCASARASRRKNWAPTPMPTTHISRRSEAGQRDIRWSTITRLLHALGATTAELAAEVERQSQQEDSSDGSRQEAPRVATMSLPTCAPGVGKDHQPRAGTRRSRRRLDQLQPLPTIPQSLPFATRRALGRIISE